MYFQELYSALLKVVKDTKGIYKLISRKHTVKMPLQKVKKKNPKEGHSQITTQNIESPPRG